jgi:hypothetical protein
MGDWTTMLTLPRTATRPADGTVVVRLRADEPAWVLALPPMPGRARLGITLGDASLRSAHDALADRGYDLLAVVAGRRPGLHADVLVTADLREAQPRWFAALMLPAERVFDLRFGPVHVALRDELAVHLTQRPDTAPPGEAGPR